MIGLDSKTTSKSLQPGDFVAYESNPSSTTVSGDEGILRSVLEELTHHHHDDLVHRQKVDVAYHSHHMQNLSTKYLESLRDELPSKQISRNSSTVLMFSSERDPEEHISGNTRARLPSG